MATASTITNNDEARINAGDIYLPTDDADLTANLPSIQYEACAGTRDASIVRLRRRKNAVLVGKCITVTYLTALMSNCRALISEVKNPRLKLFSKYLQTKNVLHQPLFVGIIGCGRIGKMIAGCILSHTNVQPKELFVSTRQPDKCAELKARGVKVVYNNVKVAEQCHLLILCFTPGQLVTVSNEISGAIRADCIVYSSLAGVPSMRVSRLLRTSNVIKDEFNYYPDENRIANWQTTDLETALSTNNTMLAYIPYASQSQAAPVVIKKKWIEVVIYALLNVCKSANMDTKQAVYTINCTVLGEEKVNARLCFSVEHIFGKAAAPRELPWYSLVDLANASHRTPLTEVLDYVTLINHLLKQQFMQIMQSQTNN